MPVAVKVIKEQFFSQKAMKYLFDCEIQAARELSHPNIVAFFEVVREEGMCYIFM
jgi:serine/threonine protein kinase